MNKEKKKNCTEWAKGKQRVERYELWVLPPGEILLIFPSHAAICVTFTQHNSVLSRCHDLCADEDISVSGLLRKISSLFINIYYVFGDRYHELVKLPDPVMCG